MHPVNEIAQLTESQPARRPSCAFTTASCKSGRPPSRVNTREEETAFDFAFVLRRPRTETDCRWVGRDVTVSTMGLAKFLKSSIRCRFARAVSQNVLKSSGCTRDFR